MYVSTLLEILADKTPEAFAVFDLKMFQPFLRFWRRADQEGGRPRGPAVSIRFNPS